jgi:hypothetical protein
MKCWSKQAALKHPRSVAQSVSDASVFMGALTSNANSWASAKRHITSVNPCYLFSPSLRLPLFRIIAPNIFQPLCYERRVLNLRALTDKDWRSSIEASAVRQNCISHCGSSIQADRRVKTQALVDAILKIAARL